MRTMRQMQAAAKWDTGFDKPASEPPVRVQPVVRRIDVGIVHRMVREIDHATTGYLFRQARKKAKLSLREMARRLKLSAPFVSDLELGRRNWTEEMAERFTDILCPPNAEVSHPAGRKPESEGMK